MLAAGSGEVLVIARLLTLIDRDGEAAEAPEESVTLRVKVNVPWAVGVPEIDTELDALAASDSPPGSVPDATDQLNVPEPPVASTVAV
jgi:hypothetical protein